MLEVKSLSVRCGALDIVKGVSFAVNDGVTVFLDESLKRFQTVFPACGSSNSAVELTIPELERYSHFSAWIDVCKLVSP